MCINIRRAYLDDIDVLVQMCAEHAAYERATYETEGKAILLAQAIFSPQPRVNVWVADNGKKLIGYVSVTIDYSTWSARDFLYLDCLFVRECFRGNGVGSMLLNATIVFAQKIAAHHIQWQTPEWNVEAAKFYRRVGTVETAKRRFTLAVKTLGPAIF